MARHSKLASSRRTILKGTGALARSGRDAGSSAPAVHAQEPKVLRYLGTAVNQSTEIAKKVKEDTGITIEYIPVTTDEVTKRVVTQPNSFDIVDEEYFSLKKVIPSGNLLGMDAKRIKNVDKITPIFTKGELPGGKKIGDQGTAPKKVFFLEGPNSKTFAKSPTQWITLIPTTYNADTLGIRPDIVKRPIESWKELLNPEFKGKASILNIPSIGIMDAAMVVEASGLHKYKDKGNMTKAEIDLTMKVMTEAKKAGQFRAFWKDFNESVNLMASGEVVIQSMWSPAVDRGARSKGIACTYQPLKEGYRAWAAGFGIPRTTVGKMADLAYEFINWFLDGWAGAFLNRQGYYSAVLDTAKSRWSPMSGRSGWKASPPKRTSRRRTARCSRKAGSVRDGGSYEARMGGVACWNAVMDENDYLVKKWNEFIAA